MECIEELQSLGLQSQAVPALCVTRLEERLKSPAPCLQVLLCAWLALTELFL